MIKTTLASIAFGALFLAGCSATGNASFESPEAAVQKLVQAAEDEKAAEELLGAGGFSMLRSGDEVADRADLEAVSALIQEKLAFEDLGDGRKIALLGNEGWELPIPLVQDGKRWRFDVAAGAEEIKNRRVGRNELSTLATLHELVQAQREYAAEARDGNPPAFATRLLSSEGKHDGLYWPTDEGQPESPLGPLVADAAAEGYRSGGDQAVPFHGYYFRLLTRQGPHAPGGKREYVDEHGLLTRGFGVLAWPASYGQSGVMTFMVNQQGIVFQKDIGPTTAASVPLLQAFDPDANWTPTAD
jgi:Protein of unknown function (DUF2950)